MRRIITFITSCALIALIAVSSGAHAQTAAGLTGGVQSTGSISSSAGASAQGNGSANVDAGTLGTGSGSVNAGANDSAHANGNAGTVSGQGTGEAASSGGNAGLVLTRSQAASASLDTQSASMSASAVVSPDDLNRYATAFMKRDASIASIDASNDHVTVAYDTPAKFLGFIPVNLRARTTVSRDGSVSISYPWYRFLFSVPNAVNSDDLKASLEGTLLANASAGFDPMSQAAIIERIRDAFSGASVSTQGSGSGSANATGTSASASSNSAGNPGTGSAGTSAGANGSGLGY